MARQRVPVQVNQFVGGLDTESNLINFPPNASVDEDNMEINKNGSRSRRDGFNLEDSYSEVDTGIYTQAGERMARSQFRWENPGGKSNRQFLVVQLGNYLAIHDLDGATISGSLLYSTTYNVSTYSTTFGYASIDGTLVVGTGEKEISIFNFDGDATITKTTDILLIRDFFGVEATVGGVELTDFLNVQVRPTSINDAHLYNLRNQTWALPRVEGDADTTNLIDPIAEFYTESGTGSATKVYPSNADSVVPHLLANANLASNRTVERFNAEDLFKSPSGTSRAPWGYFVIDALERGTSRLAQEALLRSNNSTLSLSVTSLPTDRTPDGPSVLTQYAGRIWYAGFSGEVIGGDGRSPRMSSYVLFSRVIQDPSQITKCYQEADPTSHIDSFVVDDDGGFIKIDGAYRINRMVQAQASLFIFANNGVWRVVGVDENVFSATGYSVFKITDKGCVAPNSVVVFNSSVIYWSEDGIQVITISQETGDWDTQDITQTSVQSFYQAISSSSKATVSGYHDQINNAIRWLYGVSLGSQTDAYELILNTKFNVFTKNKIKTSNLLEGPVSVSGGQTIQVGQTGVVTVGAVTVTVSGVDVTSEAASASRDASSAFYCIVLESSPTITYSFGGYKEDTVYDWIDLGSLDSPAYIITGPMTGGEGRLKKNVPYITVYMDRTTDIESSCILSSRWGWTSDAAAGKWSNPRQAYRVLRNVTGEEIIRTRNKIRGFGPCVSFKFESEEGKKLILFGWEFNLESTTDE